MDIDTKHALLKKLMTGSKQQVYDMIIALYTKQHRGVVSFLYFANLMHWRLVESRSKKAQAKQAKQYKKALQTANFLLPDGIALQVFAKYITKKRYTNLNGTDFIPFFIDQLTQEGKKLHIALYSVYDEKIGKSSQVNVKAVNYIQNRRGIDTSDIHLQQDEYTQRGTGFDRNIYKTSLEASDADIRLLLTCTGTPHQEIWTHQHEIFFKQHHILVYNAGGLLDYRSGFEKRAPDRVVNARVLETPWRIIQHPKKNIKKLWWMFGIVRYWFSRICGR